MRHQDPQGLVGPTLLIADPRAGSWLDMSILRGEVDLRKFPELLLVSEFLSAYM